MKHRLMLLGDRIDWAFIDSRFRTVCASGLGQPGLPTRLVAGLFILKHMHSLSDEALCARWLENPYYQYFCGEHAFCHQLPFDRTNAQWIVVKPRPNVTVADAEEAVMVTLRRMRHLRPSQANSFDLLTQDQILDTFNKLTGVFFLVMIVLSAVALLVGGIGVMAIMMVSVTDRTREIGVRKALGATRLDILLQFLVEAATLTGIGGLIGICLGLGFGRLATSAMRIEATTPLLYTLVAVIVSVGIGVVFGLLPANRAARLDPVEALRYE